MYGLRLSGVTSSTLRPKRSSRKYDSSMKLSYVFMPGRNSTKTSTSLSGVKLSVRKEPKILILDTPKNLKNNHKKSLPAFNEKALCSGRYWVRTSDPLLVRQVL